jgi:hypothetical protein
MVDKEIIKKRLGSLSEQDLVRVDTELRRAFGLGRARES